MIGLPFSPTAGAGGGGGILSSGGLPGNLMGGMSNAMGLNLSGIPFIGGMFPNPNEAAHLEAIRKAGEEFQSYRPQMMQAQQQALQNILGAYAPAQAALGQMYGGHAPQPVPGLPMQPPSPPRGGAVGAGLPGRMPPIVGPVGMRPGALAQLFEGVR